MHFYLGKSVRNLTKPLCASIAWEGQILRFTSPDTGQDRWNFADGDLRAPMTACHFLVGRQIDARVLLVKFCSTWLTGKLARQSITESSHEAIAIKAAHNAAQFSPEHSNTQQPRTSTKQFKRIGFGRTEYHEPSHRYG